MVVPIFCSPSCACSQVRRDLYPYNTKTGNCMPMPCMSHLRALPLEFIPCLQNSPEHQKGFCNRDVSKPSHRQERLGSGSAAGTTSGRHSANQHRERLKEHAKLSALSLPSRRERSGPKNDSKTSSVDRVRPGCRSRIPMPRVALILRYGRDQSAHRMFLNYNCSL